MTTTERLFDVEAEPGPSPVMQRAGRLLARRAHSRQELGDKLARAGFDEVAIEECLDRLSSLRLLDDLAFAREWVAQRIERRTLSTEALRHELAVKGVDAAVASEAIEEAAAGELARATHAAGAQLRKVSGLPIRAQAARITAGLLRRGFSEEVAEEAAMAVLPPEGWD